MGRQGRRSGLGVVAAAGSLVALLGWACDGGAVAVDAVTAPDGGADAGPIADAGGDDGAYRCPNSITSDEICSQGACVKAWGSGASYCGDSCAGPAECADKLNPFPVPLACHPAGYCTRPCSSPADCFLATGFEATCDADAGVCDFCPGCF